MTGRGDGGKQRPVKADLNVVGFSKGGKFFGGCWYKPSGVILE